MSKEFTFMMVWVRIAVEIDERGTDAASITPAVPRSSSVIWDGGDACEH